MAAHGASGDGGARAQRQLAASQSFDAAAGREHQHDVGGLRTNLPADAAAGDRHEHGVGEATLGIANDHDAAAIATADDEGHLRDIRDDGDGIGTLHEAFRNDVIALATQFVEHFGGREDAVFLAGLRMGQVGSAQGKGEQGQDKQATDEMGHGAILVARRNSSSAELTPRLRLR